MIFMLDRDSNINLKKQITIKENENLEKGTIIMT